ncbi:hypothetical protein ES288_A12G097400v1 [Gossypium darwinii]|uniref:Putative plant transposon protein domain-containing protein n=1 Tax=Gossypium darwinii TaxID=34276 RepID=A0A5D2E7V3_GOSDA|nr:hypothetical protein ES288_A12G097400v1 [Gossypium darwinii]
MDIIIDYLINSKGEWTRQLDTQFPISFPYVRQSPLAKIWFQFICTRIYLEVNVSKINTLAATILYAILQNERICIGTWIYRSMICCVREKKIGSLFPHLVTALCKQAKVSMQRSKLFLQPSKNPIRVFGARQFVELHK